MKDEILELTKQISNKELKEILDNILKNEE